MKTRRDFIKSSAAFGAVCCGLGMTSLMTSCTSVKYVTAEKTGDSLTFPLSAFEESSFVVIDMEGLRSPVYVKKVHDQKYRAFLMLCTHKGCDVQPAGSIMVCPCHGAEFSGEGNVLKGPATKPLMEFKTIINNTNLVIEEALKN